MAVLTKHGFFLKLKWLPATNTKQRRVSVSWRGWATEDHRMVRRVVNHDFETDESGYVQWAIAQFLEWLNNGVLSERQAATVMTADLGNGETGIIVSTSYVHAT